MIWTNRLTLRCHESVTFHIGWTK